MSTTVDSRRGRIALMVAHCAGMVDLVALPVWVGTLIAHYGLPPPQAGGLATLFLGGAVASSLFFAPRFNRFNGRVVASLGFLLAALAFFALGTTADYGLMAALHAFGGMAAGAALSFTHGTIGRSRHPHRLFAIVGMALGVFAIVFLGATPKLVDQFGGAALFKVFAGVMLVAALVSTVAFPSPDAEPAVTRGGNARLGASVWASVVGITCMATVQALVFSFIERIGMDRGFGVDAVTAVLIALGIVNLFPAPLAALLERRWPAHRVLLAAPVVQAAIAMVITHSAGYAPYALATSCLAAVMIFSHTFAFGLIARLDTTGRALAGTPAMMMVGSAIGPVLGGILVGAWGYGSLGLAALVLAAIAVASFWRLQRGATVLPFAA